jgi:mannose-6-phosphate isomerase
MPDSAAAAMQQPLTFEPLFVERIWGGRRLEELFGKQLPASKRIGESWELVDRGEAQSVVAAGPWKGRTLHELWMHDRAQVFGRIADAPRFPLLIKLLDASEKLSLQVHPPPAIAADLGGEPKTEFWYIALTDALNDGTLEEHVHHIAVQSGDAMFLPSGRMHAIGAGNIIVEIQQNSDTTYRVFDWNRTDESGQRRQLHIDESLQSIDFEDFEPDLVRAAGESLVRDRLFHVDEWELKQPRQIMPAGQFALVICVAGEVECSGTRIRAGELLLIPAELRDRTARPLQPGTTMLRVTIGD